MTIVIVIVLVLGAVHEHEYDGVREYEYEYDDEDDDDPPVQRGTPGYPAFSVSTQWNLSMHSVNRFVVE